MANSSKWSKRLLALFCSMVLSVIAAEIAARHYFYPIRFYNNFTYIPTIYDPLLGYLPEPDWHGLMQNLDYSVNVSIGSDGLRATSNVLKNENNSESAIFFGDSFIFGDGLNDEQTIPSQVSLALSGEGKNIKCLNAGVLGWSPAQALLYYQRLSQKNKFDKVIYGICLENDIADNSAFLSGRFQLSKDTIVWLNKNASPPTNAEDISIVKKLLRSSRLYVVFASYLRRFAPMLRSKIEKSGAVNNTFKEQQNNVSKFFRTSQDSETEKSWEKLQDVLKIWKQETELEKRELILVPFSSAWMIDDNLFSKLTAQWPEGKYDRTYVLNRVKEIAEKENIRVIDPSSMIRKEHFYIFDGHLKPDGAKIAARFIADNL